MTNLDLLDTAVRIVKRHGPWEVKAVEAYKGGPPVIHICWVSPNTIADVKRVYALLHPL